MNAIGVHECYRELCYAVVSASSLTQNPCKQLVNDACALKRLCLLHGIDVLCLVVTRLYDVFAESKLPLVHSHSKAQPRHSSCAFAIHAVDATHLAALGDLRAEQLRHQSSIGRASGWIACKPNHCLSSIASSCSEGYRAHRCADSVQTRAACRGLHYRREPFKLPPRPSLRCGRHVRTMHTAWMSSHIGCTVVRTIRRSTCTSPTIYAAIR